MNEVYSPYTGGNSARAAYAIPVINKCISQYSKIYVKAHNAIAT